MKFLYTFAVFTLTTEADLFWGCNDIKYNYLQYLVLLERQRTRGEGILLA